MVQAEGDQGVRGHGGHFEEEVDIEKIAGQNQAVHAGDHDQQQGVVIGFGPVVLHVVDGEQGGGEADQGDGQKHEQAEPVRAQADVERLAEPEGLLDDAAAGDQGPARDRGVNEQEEHGGAGQQVGQEAL